ncbi:MAG: SprB repeat-containing protein, partial [Cyclobacteriaceae bacterium]
MKRGILAALVGIFIWIGSTQSTLAQCTGDPITSFSITNIQDVSCNGGSDGSITVEVVGGEAPYVFELNVDFGGGGVAPFLNSPSTTDTEYTFTNLPAESTTGGSYQLVVKTSNSHPSGNTTH